MAKSGIYWYVDPGVVGQKLSVAADKIPLYLGEAVSPVIDEATQMIRSRVMELGRIRTGDMYSSIDGDMRIAGGRVQANFGFTNGAPFYTIFQEFGTRGRHGGMDNQAAKRGFERKPTAGNSGIMAMHAFVDASLMVQRVLHDRISRIDIWRDFR